MEELWKQIVIPDAVEKYLELFRSYIAPLSGHLNTIPRWGWVCGGLVGACVCFKVYYDVTYGVWKRQGVDGPKPVPFFGTANVFMTRKSFHDVDKMLAAKYGHKGYYG